MRGESYRGLLFYPNLVSDVAASWKLAATFRSIA